jgi:hypothetical protein
MHLLAFETNLSHLWVTCVGRGQRFCDKNFLSSEKLAKFLGNGSRCQVTSFRGLLVFEIVQRNS